MTDVEIASKVARLAQRYKDQKPAPGGEAALRRVISEIQTGEPDYSQMSSGLAEATRQDLPEIKSLLDAIGPLESVSFKRVDKGGADRYQVKFERLAMEWEIQMGADGKIERLNASR